MCPFSSFLFLFTFFLFFFPFLFSFFLSFFLSCVPCADLSDREAQWGSPHHSPLRTCLSVRDSTSPTLLTPHNSSRPTTPHAPQLLTPHNSSRPTTPHAPQLLTPHNSSRPTTPHAPQLLTPHRPPPPLPPSKTPSSPQTPKYSIPALSFFQVSMRPFFPRCCSWQLILACPQM